jgi:hypothetical protein
MRDIFRDAGCLLAILLSSLLSGCGGGSGSGSPPSSPGGSAPVVAVPSQPAAVFFGMHQSHTAACDTGDLAYPLFDARAGTFRIWSTCKTQWADMNPASNSFDFTGLDGLLAALKIKGINDVYISLGSTPNWISSNPTDILCDRANVFGEPPGMCDPPADLNSDGSGTDLAWRSFVTALVGHVSAAGYLSTHAHITYYEIWSEFHRSDTVGVPGTTCFTPGSSAGIPCSYRGTFAQMLRMTQDMRCIVEGHTSDPITGLGLTCGTANYAQTGVDPTAGVMEGDAGGGLLDDGTATLENYLYCDANPPTGSQCNWSRSNPLGANATDVISGHSYFNNGDSPESVMRFVAAEKAMLSPADAAKPYFTGEGSWGKNYSVGEPSIQAAYVARWFAVLLLAHADRGYWFAWDEFENSGNGGLWSPTPLTAPPLECSTPDTAIGGYYCTGGIAYAQTVDWLSGATVVTGTCPASCSEPSSGVFSLTISRTGGYQAQMLWDSSKVSTCVNPMCGSTPIPQPPSFAVSQWRDTAGNTHSGMPPNIGASPIILENMPPPS